MCYSRVLYTTIIEESEILGAYAAVHMFNALLLLLQVLHYFWFYLICQVAISAFRAGKVWWNFCWTLFKKKNHFSFQVTKDERSDSDDSDAEPNVTNGDVNKDKWSTFFMMNVIVYNYSERMTIISIFYRFFCFAFFFFFFKQRTFGFTTYTIHSYPFDIFYLFAVSFFCLFACFFFLSS
jgi:hypothetical protein